MLRLETIAIQVSFTYSLLRVLKEQNVLITVFSTNFDPLQGDHYSSHVNMWYTT